MVGTFWPWVKFEFPEKHAQLSFQLCQFLSRRIWDKDVIGDAKSYSERNEALKARSPQPWQLLPSEPTQRASKSGPALDLLTRKSHALEGTPNLCVAQSILAADELGRLHTFKQFSVCSVLTVCISLYLTSLEWPSRKWVVAWKIAYK